MLRSVIPVLFAACKKQLFDKKCCLSTATCSTLLESDSFRKLLKSADNLYSNFSTKDGAMELSAKSMPNLRTNSGNLLQTLHEIDCRLQEQKQTITDLRRMIGIKPSLLQLRLFTQLF